jgi:oligoribonuclease NrnB/cAMP/cGMP phosphodiesterase (DHH superfamily)
MNRIVIYHGACRDGFAAAWCAWRFGWHDSTFHPGVHGQDPPDVTGCDVLMVDFSYPRAVLDDMAAKASHLQVLDHHKTAGEALKGAPYTLFDMDRSGAGLTWDTLAPSVSHPRPWIVDYVEDRDLWRHALSMSEEVNAFIATLEFDFDVWEKTNASMPLTSAKYLGEVALAKTQQYVREVRKNARVVNFEGHRVPLVNAPQVDISEVLDSLVDEVPFAMGWWQRADGSFSYSLRSRRLDVSAIAKKYGGGGHHLASGFQSKDMLNLS